MILYLSRYQLDSSELLTTAVERMNHTSSGSFDRYR